MIAEHLEKQAGDEMRSSLVAMVGATVLVFVILSLYHAPSGSGDANGTVFTPKHLPRIVPGNDLYIRDLGMRMIWCPPGEFLMGGQDSHSELPRHPVRLTQGFWLAETELTQRQYETVTGINPSAFQHAGPTAPVECVDWTDSVAYCKALTEHYQSSLPSGYVFGLPTEAQWEYACRGGLPPGIEIYHPPGPLHEQDDFIAPLLDELGWYAGNCGVNYPGGAPSHSWTPTLHPSETGGTHPAALKIPNPWGFYDMLGNVSEWVHDRRYGRYFSGLQVDPEGPIVMGLGRIYRGGAWYDKCTACRVFDRSDDFEDFWSWAVGFRVAIRPPTSTP